MNIKDILAALWLLFFFGSIIGLGIYFMPHAMAMIGIALAVIGITGWALQRIG